MYVRQASLSDFHLKSPWIEIPESLSRLGFSSTIIAGKVRTSRPLRSRVRESGVLGERLVNSLREFLRVIPMLREESPRLAIVYASMSLAPLYILLQRVGLNPSKAKNSGHNFKTVWINKLDWDGTNSPSVGLLANTLRKFVVAVTSHLYDWTTVEGRSSLRRISRIPMINRGRLAVLEVGFPDDFYGLTKYEESEREKIVLCVARIAPEKGLSILLRAFAEARSQYPDWKLVLAGPVTDCAYFDELKREILRLGLTTAVELPGFLDDTDLHALYVKSSIFCLPSLLENAGQVRFEAMANGLPLITSETGTGIDLRESGAAVVPPGDLPSLVIVLKDLMSSSSKRAMAADSQQAHLRSYLEICRQLVRQTCSNCQT